MRPPNPSRPSSSMFARWFIAWLFGCGLFLFTSVATNYDGFDTIVGVTIIGPFVSAVGVAACAVIGLPLLIPPLGRLWRASHVPAAVVALIGLALLAFSFAPGQLKEIVPAQDGGPIQEVGVTWFPGYLLLLFAITKFPSPTRPARTTAP